MHYELHLPFPPTINSYYKRGNNYQYISMKGKKFRAAVEAEVEQQMAGLGVLPLEDRLYVIVVVHMPDKRTRDVDNYMKALLDACTKAGVWIDDEQIDQLIIYRGAQCYSGAIAMAITDGGPEIPIGYPVHKL